MVELDDKVEEVVAILNGIAPICTNKHNNVSYLELSLSNEELLPSIVQVPTLELKPLLKHLKYIY